MTAAVSVNPLFITTPTLPSAFIHSMQYVWASATVTRCPGGFEYFLSRFFSVFLIYLLLLFSFFLFSFVPSISHSLFFFAFHLLFFPFFLSFVIIFHSFFLFFSPLIFFSLSLPHTLCLSSHLILPVHIQFHMSQYTEGLYSLNLSTDFNLCDLLL